MFSKRLVQLWAASVGLAVAAGCGAAPAADEPKDAGEVGVVQAPLIGADASTAIPGQYIVVMQESVSGAGVLAAASTPGVAVSHVYSIIPAFAASLTDQALLSLRQDPNVKYVALDQVVTINAVQANPRWGLDRIDQRTGTDGRYNDFGYSGYGVHVYVIDTGIRSTHVEFTGRMGAGISEIPGSPSTEDCNGHGSHVASSAAGTLYGVAKNATLHPVRVLDCNGSGQFSWVIAGIDWVAQNATRPAVVNMSLGGGAFQPVDDALAAMIASGVAAAVAAGNSNDNACNYSPSRTPAAVTVGATNLGDDTRALFSNWGTCVDIFAPGVNVIGAWYTSDTATNTISGTSMASPQVAGALALYLQRYPSLGAGDASDDVIAAATAGVVGSPNGSPNRFLYANFGTPRASSCYGHCGGQAPSFQCFCDPSCTYFGDCCADYQSLCR